jgi:hypothetical protein
MMSYIVLGYGKFGRLAVERLHAAFPSISITVVERSPAQVAGCSPAGAAVVREDATAFLLTSELATPEAIIIPMVPFHLAASYIMARASGCRESPLPANLMEMVPNPLRLDEATLCCSKADFLCPDDCPEGDACTVTGLPRTPLYCDLEALRIPEITVLIQRSAQILPGIGGYQFKDLQSMALRIPSGKYIVGTSCKCHAIMTGLEVDDLDRSSCG